jgi:hypothetical protein
MLLQFDCMDRRGADADATAFVLHAMGLIGKDDRTNIVDTHSSIYGDRFCGSIYFEANERAKKILEENCHKKLADYNPRLSVVGPRESHLAPILLFVRLQAMDAKAFCSVAKNTVKGRATASIIESSGHQTTDRNSGSKYFYLDMKVEVPDEQTERDLIGDMQTLAEEHSWDLDVCRLRPRKSRLTKTCRNFSDRVIESIEKAHLRN